MLPADQSDVELTGTLRDGQAYGRRLMFSELYASLPRDAEARVTVYSWEIAAGCATDWHIHNGPALFVVLSGRIAIEFRDTCEPHVAGDAYFEPIGVIHRGVNAGVAKAVAGVGFVLTSPDREDVVNVKEPW
jgi:quercetin dioxygenase-like cupin family protein